MIFAKHKYVHNFLNALGSGDTFMQDQMNVDQLTRLTLEHRPKVIKALRESGVDVKANADVETVSKLILENANYNDSLANELTDLIIEYNIPKEEWKLSADGELFKDLFSESKEYLQGDEFKVVARTAIFNGIQKISDTANEAKLGNSNSAVPTLAEQYQERIRLAQNQAAMLKKEKEPLTTGQKVAIGIGITALLLIATYVIIKMNKGKSDSKSKGGKPEAVKASVPAEGSAEAPVQA